MPKELVTLREARERLGLSKTTMTKLVRERDFTLYENPKDKRSRLVDWVEVEAAMQPRPIASGATKKAAAWVDRLAA